MTAISSVCGLTANWMFEPPVSTPTARMTWIAWSRSVWNWRSVSVCCGATVIESPVWTPIGSTFLIEQTMTTLSLRRSEEHTSELQSRQYLVCRLLLETKNNTYATRSRTRSLLDHC